MEDQKTFPGPCIGFRRFRLSADGHLRSTGAGAIAWRPGPNLAYCREHTAPRADCSCGFYLCYDPARIPVDLAGGGEVLAAVLCRGDVLIHTEGFRCEEAQILALALEGGGLVARGKAQRAAELYGVPLLDPDELLAEASRYGAVPLAPLREREECDIGDFISDSQFSALRWSLMSAAMALLVAIMSYGLRGGFDASVAAISALVFLPGLCFMGIWEASAALALARWEQGRRFSSLLLIGALTLVYTGGWIGALLILRGTDFDPMASWPGALGAAFLASVMVASSIISGYRLGSDERRSLTSF